MVKFFVLISLAGLLVLAGLAALTGGGAISIAGTVLLALLMCLAVHDVLQRKHSILRNYPVAGHLRFLFEAIRPEMQQYFIERNYDGRPYDRDTRTVIYERARGSTASRRSGPSAIWPSLGTSGCCTPTWRLTRPTRCRAFGSEDRNARAPTTWRC